MRGEPGRASKRLGCQSGDRLDPPRAEVLLWSHFVYVELTYYLYTDYITFVLVK